MTGLRVVTCGTFSHAGASELHDLVRAFRSGDEAAFETMVATAQAGLARELPELVAMEDLLVVPMPGHRALGSASPLGRCAAAIVATRPGWSNRPDLLRRVSDAPEAKAGGLRDVAAEASTLRWAPTPRSGTVLLFDDVVRSGATLGAAWQAAEPNLRRRLIALAVFRATR
jgi:predicted amidophosphoribosyltransferase